MEALSPIFEQVTSPYDPFITLSYFKFSITIVFALLAATYFSCKYKRVYLLDFVCFQPPETLRAPLSSFLEHMEYVDFNKEAITFQKKVLERSGIGNETCLPAGIHCIPRDNSLDSTLEECKLVLFTVVEDLLVKTKINPKSIDFLVTNCSIYCPTPSLASMIINRFGFRSNVKSFNLSGMGCSAGLLSTSLAHDLLKVHKDSLVLVVSTESICSAVYNGKVKAMLLPNCLFRMGGVAALLSNRTSDKNVAKYELCHVVRTHLGAKDSAYKCVYQEVDNDEQVGVTLQRNVVQVAGESLKTNMGSLGPLVLPYTEQILYALSVLWRKAWPPAKKKGHEYVPNFKKAFEHFCIHAGGKAVIEAIKESLKLTERHVEASRMTLYRFGNTSSSSTWYSLCYLEAKGRVKKGDRVWQLCFGSGFKCNSAVWKCVAKDALMKDRSKNAWIDRIYEYPIRVPEVTFH
ncbi:hypothetical protein V2J09_013844 [Rumex salicifolius]